ncbi:MAG: 3-methyladenine DNA glycosylase [Helicobacteraceae bacterium]
MYSSDIFWKFVELDLVKENYPLWWPGAGEFSVVISAILTQQSKWERVKLALQNLQKLGLTSAQDIDSADFYVLASAISPAGLYNQKASRLKALCKNLLADFGSEQNFRQHVGREWLLAQKGIGQETADAVLNFYSFKPVMVVDSYTMRFLRALDFTFETYDEAKEWLESGIFTDLDAIQERLGLKDYEVFALFHGGFVEFGKTKRSAKDLGLD